MGTVTGKYGYNVICDVCGFKFKNTELKKRWDGLWVCKDDWETRHPLDFYKPRNDTHTLPYTRPEPSDGVASGYPHGYRLVQETGDTGSPPIGLLTQEDTDHIILEEAP